MVWDATVVDSLASSYRAVAVTSSGAVAAGAEVRKESKYCQLSHSYHFVPLAIESLGAIGPKSWSLVRDLGRRIMNYSGEARSFSFLLQRLSVTIQRGNSILIRSTLPPLLDTLFGT